MKLEHVAINVSEPAKLAQWLIENLGLRSVMSLQEPPYTNFLADETGSMIELYHNTTASIPDYASISPFTLHFAFATSNIEAARQQLIDAGATPIGEISQTPAGDKLAFLRTPWHEPLQLVQRAQPLV